MKNSYNMFNSQVIHETGKYKVAKSEKGMIYVQFNEMKSGSFAWVFIEDLKSVINCRPQWQQKIIASVDRRFNK